MKKFAKILITRKNSNLRKRCTFHSEKISKVIEFLTFCLKLYSMFHYQTENFQEMYGDDSESNSNVESKIEVCTGQGLVRTRQMTDYFSNGPGKREMSFATLGTGYIKKEYCASVRADIKKTKFSSRRRRIEK